MNTVQVAPVGGAVTITPPVVAVAQCRSCRADIEYLGELIVRLCDGCLDVVAGDAEVSLPAHRAVEFVELHDCGCEEVVDSGDSGEERDVYVRPIEHIEPKGRLFTDELKPVTRAASLCATCVNATQYRCRCARLCCYACVDATGLCPQCEGDVVEDDEEA